MANEVRELAASINGQPVGILRDEGGYWTFEYDPAWLASPGRYAISPGLPLQSEKIVDTGSQRPVQWFCDNLLPEEDARKLLARDAEVDVGDAWGLLAYFGAESAGAITLLPPGTAPAAAGVRILSDEELQHRIDELPRRSLSADSPKRMSLAGAQAKLPVTVRDGQLYEPIGGECSTHILKPDSKTEGFPHTAINEAFCMHLAGHDRLPVPASEFRAAPSSIYLVERFDRKFSAQGVERLHTLDGLQLLSLDRQLKYPKASVESLNACISLCRTQAQARINLYRWTIFNVLIGNNDAHMKNISFFVGPAGISLAPFYDLVSTAVYSTREYDPRGPYWPDIPLAMPIGHARYFAELTRGDIVEFGVQLGLREASAAETLSLQISLLNHGLPAIAESYLRKATPGEQRIINAIVAIPIREMSARLRAK